MILEDDDIIEENLNESLTNLIILPYDNPRNSKLINDYITTIYNNDESPQ